MKHRSRKIAISACLLGERCRYDGRDNYDALLLSHLSDATLIPFCPEAHAFGTPRPTMDLVETPSGIKAISNESGEVLSAPLEAYAKRFFDSHEKIDLLIGKDRSPSCGVCSARVYSTDKTLLRDTEAGLMVKEACKRGIKRVDAEMYGRWLKG